MSSEWVSSAILLGTTLSISVVLTFMMRGKINGSRGMLVILFLGFFAGIGGASHGPGEMLQGSTPPTGLMIEAWPRLTLLDGEPAITLIPNYLVTGIIAMAMGLVVAAWTATSMDRRNGGLMLILLSVLMLPIGAGLIPPIPGVVAGALSHWKGLKSVDSKMAYATRSQV